MSHLRSYRPLGHLALVLLLGAVHVSAAVPFASPPDQPGSTLSLGSVEREAARALRLGSASVSLALVSEGRVAWAGAWGYANVWSATKATPETVYNVGSTLKAITATAALRLVDEGRLELDTPVEAYLGDLVPPTLRGRTPTLRQLLTHTSGLEDTTEFLEIWDPGQPVPTLETIARTSRPLRAPGSGYAYSNQGFALVGLLIERVRGQRFGTVIAREILEPLGIHRESIVGLEPEILERLALPYKPGPDGRPHPVPQMRTALFPAGDAYLSPTEYARFLLAHLGGGELDDSRILSVVSTREMQSFQLPSYGLGWGLSIATGRTLIGHGGRVPGYSAFVLADPTEGTGAVAFATSGDLTRLVNAGRAALAGEVYVPPEERIAVQLDPSLLDQYVGCYEPQPEVAIEVVREGNRLLARYPGAPEFELRAERRDYFFLSPVDARISFVRSPEGTIERMVIDPGPSAKKLDSCPPSTLGAIEK